MPPPPENGRHNMLRISQRNGLERAEHLDTSRVKASPPPGLRGGRRPRVRYHRDPRARPGGRPGPGANAGSSRVTARADRGRATRRGFAASWSLGSESSTPNSSRTAAERGSSASGRSASASQTAAPRLVAAAWARALSCARALGCGLSADIDSGYAGSSTGRPEGGGMDGRAVGTAPLQPATRLASRSRAEADSP